MKQSTSGKKKSNTDTETFERFMVEIGQWKIVEGQVTILQSPYISSKDLTARFKTWKGK